jgi:antitoxin component of RelBE/YafQ-DinJ toxin-antitoxin module
MEAGMTERVQVRLDDEDKAWVEAEAKRLGVSHSDVIRMILKQRRAADLARGVA